MGIKKKNTPDEIERYQRSVVFLLKMLAKSVERNKEMALWFIEREGWSYENVSEQFGIPEGALRRWVKEARE